MKNGKPSLIYDIRYFTERPGAGIPQLGPYLGNATVDAYGRRLAWLLNSKGISLGAYHSLYIQLTSAISLGSVHEIEYKGGHEDWWLHLVSVGVQKDFAVSSDIFEIVRSATLSALRTLLPDASAEIEQADGIVIKHAGDLRFLLREISHKKHLLKIGATISAHPNPCWLYVAASNTASGATGETSGLPFGLHYDAFDEARSVKPSDLEIVPSANGQIYVEWSGAIRTKGPRLKTSEADKSHAIYTALVRRQ